MNRLLKMVKGPKTKQPPAEMIGGRGARFGIFTQASLQVKACEVLESIPLRLPDQTPVQMACKSTNAAIPHNLAAQSVGKAIVHRTGSLICSAMG
jgi:hypothetical protein